MYYVIPGDTEEEEGNGYVGISTVDWRDCGLN